MKLFVLLLLSLVSRSYGGMSMYNNYGNCPSGFTRSEWYYRKLGAFLPSPPPVPTEAQAVNFCNSQSSYSSNYYAVILDMTSSIGYYCCKAYGTPSSDCTNAQHHVKPTAVNTDATCEDDTVTFCQGGLPFDDGGKTSDGSCGNSCANNQHTPNTIEIITNEFKIFSSGSPQMTMTQAECQTYVQTYASSKYMYVVSQDNSVAGCRYHPAFDEYSFNTYSNPTSNTCYPWSCIEKGYGYGSGLQSKSLCEAYAKTIGKSFLEANAGTEPKGCYRRYWNGDNSVRYNPCTAWNCPKASTTFQLVEITTRGSCIADTLTSCMAGYAFYNGGYAFNGMCTTCAYNQNSPGGTTTSCSQDTVTSCSAGYKFSDGGPSSNGFCTACTTNQHSAGGTVTTCSADTITSCSAGNGFSDGGKEYDGSCTQCTAITQYSPGGTSTCQDKSLLSCSIGSGYTDGGISSDNTCTQCAVTQYTPPTIVMITSGSPRFDYSMTAAECEAYAESIGKSFYERNTGTEPKGCYRNFYNGGDAVSYNPCTGWLYGCPGGSNTFQIVDIQYTSSCLEDTYLSCDPNVGYDSGGREYDSTCTICLPKEYSSGFMPCATQTFDRKYAVMDLGSVQNVVGMATRGRVDYDQRVTRYRLQYSTDGKEYFSINSEEFYFVREGECSEGTELRMYEGNGDNEGTIAERTNRCYEACISGKTPITGSYSSCSMSGFIVYPSSGRCYCECEDSSTCSPIVNGYFRYDIAPNGAFEANHDRDTVVSNYFQPVQARYVKLNIVAYYWEPTIQMAPIVSNSKQKVINPPDSMRNSVACGSSMLDAKGTCLSANGNLTIDLGKVQMVVGVVTQGRSDTEEYVTTYKLSYATADHFTNIQHTNRRFPANRDQHTKVTNYFEPVRARYIRLTPVTSKNAPSLRMGVVVMEKSMETELLEPKKKDRFEHTEVEYKNSIVYFGGVREYKKERNGKCASKQKGRVQGILTHDYVKVEGLKVDNLARVKFTTGYFTGTSVGDGYGEAIEIQTSGAIKFADGYCNGEPVTKVYRQTGVRDCYRICKDWGLFIYKYTDDCYCGQTNKNVSGCDFVTSGTDYDSYKIEEEEGTTNWLFHIKDSSYAKMVLTRVKLIDDEVYIKAIAAYYKTATYAQWRAIDDWDEYMKDAKAGLLVFSSTDHGYAISDIRAEVSTSVLSMDYWDATAYADLKSCILMCQQDESCHYISHAEERCMLHTTCEYEPDDRYTIYHVTKSQNALTQHVVKTDGSPIKSASDCYAYAESLGFKVSENHTVHIEGDYPDYEPMYTKWSSSGYCSSKYTLYDATNLNPGTTTEEKLKHCAMGCRLYAGFAMEQNGPACYCSNDPSFTCTVTNGNFDSYDLSFLVNPPELSRYYSSVFGNTERGTSNAQSMLDSPKGWDGGSASSGEWMKIDLGGMFRVVGVVTQGRNDVSQWVTKISIEYSTLDSTYIPIVETSDGEFTANSDQSTKKVNFHQPVMARYIKIYVQDYNSHPSMRAGVMVQAELCKDKHGNFIWSREKCSDTHLEGANGCIFNREKRTIRWNSNQYTSDTTMVCNATHNCIERPNAGIMDVDPDFYLEHKNEASLSKEDCKLYASRLNKVFVEGEFEFTSGCSLHKRVYYNTKMGHNCSSMFPCVKRHGHYLTAFNKTSQTWYKIPTNTPPAQRYAHSATVSGDAMYIYGGKSYVDMGDLWKFNFTTSKWSKLFEGDSVAKANMAGYKTGLLIHGGYESYGFVKSRNDWNMPIKDTKYFDFETGMHEIHRRPIIRVEYVKQATGYICDDETAQILFAGDGDNVGTMHKKLTRCSRKCKGTGGKSFSYAISNSGRCWCYPDSVKICTLKSNAYNDHYDIVDPFGQYEYHKQVNLYYSDGSGNSGAERAYYNKMSYHVATEFECEQICDASSDCHAYQYSGSSCWLRKNVQLRHTYTSAYTAMINDKRFALGHSDLSVTLEECLNYADIYKMEFKELYDETQYKGCFHGDDNVMYYNYMGTECKQRCLYRNELENAPIVADGDEMLVLGKRLMTSEVFRPYAQACVEWDEFETNDKFKPKGCIQFDKTVVYNNAASQWKLVDYGANSNTYILTGNFVNVDAIDVPTCLDACVEYEFASFDAVLGCRCANTDNSVGESGDGMGVYFQNDVQCSEQYKCVDRNMRESFDQIITIEGLFFDRQVKNPEAICVAEGSQEAELKSQASVLEALRFANDACNFVQFSGTCDKLATWDECKRYGAVEQESRVDRPKGCYLDGTYRFNLIGGECTNETPCLCRTDKYKDILTDRCKTVSEEPIIKSIVYQDRGTEKEIQTELECQVNSANKITCAQCECFADYTYGTWGGGQCETCAIGYGKTQCSTSCVDFDGLNRDTMCGGFGKCLFGSSMSGVERIFQNTECICGQEDQYQLREPEVSNDAYFKSSKTNYFFYDSITDGKTYDLEEAKLECSKYNDISLITLNKYCYGIFVRDASNLVYELQMGKTGNEFVLYFRYVEKALIGARSKNFGIEQLQFTNLIPEVAEDVQCYDDITINLEGRDVCNHFDPNKASCNECAEGFTGKNCRSKCQNCLLGGTCEEAPGDKDFASCICPTSNLWEHQCCPAGFKVIELLDWSTLPTSKVDKIKVKSGYDPYTTNEKDASYYCKKCPGVHANDWMSDVSEFKVCSGENRGDCVVNANSLKCACKLNEESGLTWKGRACSCDDSIITPYSGNDPENAEVIDYGCLIPTDGTGRCPEPNPSSVTVQRFYPKQLYSTKPFAPNQFVHGNFIGGDNYIGSELSLLSGTEWEGSIAGEIVVTVTPFGKCGFKTPCHTGEGPCEVDNDCAGTLKCTYSGANIQNYNPQRVPFDFKFCYDPNDGLVGCDPILPTVELPNFDSSVIRASYNYKFWNGQTFEEAPENHYVPMTKDGDNNLVIHKQAFPCPRGRFGTVWDGVRECKLCIPGKYQDEVGQSEIPETVCKTCDEGKFSGQYGAAAKDECFRCSRGERANDDYDGCIPCPVGTYEVGGICNLCPVGKFNDIVNQTECKNCPIGKNTFGGTGAVECYNCNPGKYAPTEGMPECLECREGSVTKLAGQSECEPCPANKYQRLTGQIECFNLTEGHRAVTDTVGGIVYRVDQTICSSGQEANDIECTDCSIGKYAEKALNDCKKCEARYYQDETNQIRCKPLGPCEKIVEENGLNVDKQTDKTRCRKCGDPDTKEPGTEHEFGEYRPKQKCYKQLTGGSCDYNYVKDNLYHPHPSQGDWRTKNWASAWAENTGNLRAENSRRYWNELTCDGCGSLSETQCNKECADNPDCTMFAVLVGSGQDSSRTKPGDCRLYSKEKDTYRGRCWTSGGWTQGYECNHGSEQYVGKFDSAHKCAKACASAGRTPYSLWWGFSWSPDWSGYTKSKQCWCENLVRQSGAGSYYCNYLDSDHYVMFSMREYMHYNSDCPNYYPYRYPCYNEE